MSNMEPFGVQLLFHSLSKRCRYLSWPVEEWTSEQSLPLSVQIFYNVPLQRHRLADGFLALILLGLSTQMKHSTTVSVLTVTCLQAPPLPFCGALWVRLVKKESITPSWFTCISTFIINPWSSIVENINFLVYSLWLKGSFLHCDLALLSSQSKESDAAAL